jgi:hypothetical protein
MTGEYVGQSCVTSSVRACHELEVSNTPSPDFHADYQRNEDR